MIPDDHPWMAPALGSCGFGALRLETDRSVELRLLRLLSNGPADALGAIAVVTSSGVAVQRADLAFNRIRYLALIEFKRMGWVITTAGKAALASQDAPPVDRAAPSLATKQLSLF